MLFRSPAAEVFKAPKLMKVCSAEFVPELVRRALPGLPLTHLPVLPAELVAAPQTEYFEIGRGGPCWEHLVKTRRFGVFVPDDLPTPELQLVIVLDSQEGVG